MLGLGKRKIILLDELLKEVALENKIQLNSSGEGLGEARGMIIARLSQSAKPFKEIIKEILGNNGLNKEKIMDFHKRITLGWGHHSIEQHTSASVAFENLTIIATNKYFENKRLAAYLERSTRYQDFSEPSYYVPKELDEKEREELKKEYIEAINYLFATYHKILPSIEKEIWKSYAERGIIEKEINIKKKAFDCARYLLPCSTYTNFGMTANSQTFRALIHDLKSIKNAELNESAEELQKELSKVFPALMSQEVCCIDEEREEHRNKKEKIRAINVAQEAQKEIEKIVIGNYEFKNIQNKVDLIDYTQNAEQLICLEYLVKEGFDAELSGGRVLLNGKELSESESENILEKVFRYNTIEEKPHRAAELANYYFETILDFGAGRDVHRNRMLTWIDSLVSPEFGFAIPYYLNEESNKEYLGALKKAFECWVKLVEQGIGKEIAQYVLPLGTNYKVFYNLNAKELYHVAKTRTAKSAHYSYREYVHKMVELVKEKQPRIGNKIKDYFEKEV